jgi:hypothetical protein
LPAGIAQVLNGLEIGNASQDRTLQGLHFRVPTPTHAVLLGILHSQVKDNFHFEWAVGLKSLNDVVAMMSCFSGAIDWEEIGSRVDRHGLRPILRTFMFSAHRLFDLPLPSGLQPTLGAFAHHMLCMAAIHWKAVDQFIVKTGRYHRYIYRRLGGRKNFLRHNADSFSPAV